MVQHYFRTKDEMMIFALDRVSENVQARLAADAAATDPSLRGMLRALLVQLLPLDEERAVEGQVALAFQAYAAVRPAVATGLRENTALMRSFLADRIRAAQVAGEAATAVDPDRTATALLALVEGLGVHVLGRHYSADEALAVFDGYLETLVGAATAVTARPGMAADT